MMKLTDTKKDLTGGGAGTFFKITENKPIQVRFLYNNVEDILADGLVAHAIAPQDSGQQYTVNVLCGLTSDEDPVANCKWCAQGHKQVGRYPLALFNLETNTVQYWLKSAQYTEGLMATLKEIVPAGQPISGQVFKMIRTGSGTSTQYNLVPVGANDGRKSNEFGEIKAPEDRGLIRPTNFEFPAVMNGGANFQQGGYNQPNAYGGNNNGYAPNANYQGRGRATTDIF